MPAASASGIPPPMVRRTKPGAALEEPVSVKRLLSEAGGEGWARMAGDDGEEDRELAFSAGGRYVAVALQGGDVAVWDLHPLPHAALYLEAPPQLAEEDGAPEDGFVVTGLSWSKGARKLLVTYRHRAFPGSHLCKWDLAGAAVEAHCKCPGPIGPAQLSPADDNLCAYFVGGVTVLRLHRLGEDMVLREVDLSAEEGRRAAGRDDEASVASGSVAAQSSSKSGGKQQQMGVCAFGQDGKALFAVVGRRVVKLEAGTLAELKRSPSDVLGPGQTQVYKMRLAPSGRLLFVFTNRAAHVVATGNLRASEALGEFGALKVEWGCWGVGPERNALGQQKQQAPVLVVMGVPAGFKRDSVQERHFVWRLPDSEPSGGEAAADEDEGPLRVEMTPDIIPGFKTGFQALELCPGRAMMLACGCEGGLFVRQEMFTTAFPGPMYAPGYAILENNRPYIEKEDELDRLPPGSAAALAKEAELNKPSDITTSEDQPIPDLSPSPTFNIRAAILPKPLPGARRGAAQAEEEGVVFPLIMHQRSKRRKLEEDDGEGGESEEEQGGFPPFLPMPAALARKRRAASSAAPSKAQRAVEEWAAKGREALKRRMEADVAGEEAEEQRRKEAARERREKERREEQERREQRLRQAQQMQQQQVAPGQHQQEQEQGKGGGPQQGAEKDDAASPHEESKEGQGMSPQRAPASASASASVPAPMQEEARPGDASAAAVDPQQQQQQQDVN